MQNHQQFLQEEINPIIEQLVYYTLKNKPSNVCQYMIDWLNENKDQFQNKSEGTDNKENKKNQEQDWLNDSDQSQEDNYEDEIEFSKQKQNKIDQKRTSVSAEVYGKFNKKENFKPKFHQKSTSQIARIRNRLQQAFMFNALDEKETEIVINAMEEKQFKQGEYIIKQGDDGDVLYVLDEGELDCYKIFPQQEKETYLKTYKPGESFGELALLYNAPRAASIIAKTNAICFSLDRDCFNNIVKQSAINKREKYEKTLEKVQILQSMDHYERQQLCDTLKSQKFNKGDFIVKQGDEGQDFFFVEEGKLVALKQLEPDQQPQKVMEYQAGDYFGELALLKNQPRAASVQAESDGIVISIDRNTFTRLLGPLDDILKRNALKYEEVKNSLNK